MSNSLTTYLERLRWNYWRGLIATLLQLAGYALITWADWRVGLGMVVLTFAWGLTGRAVR